MPTILVQTRSFSQKIKGLFVPSAIALMLSACSSSLFNQTDSVTESLRNEAYASSEFYINKADQSSKETQQSYRLLAVRKLLDENKVQEAQNQLAEINQAILNEPQRFEFYLVSAQLAAAQQNNPLALSFLKGIPQTSLSRSQQLRVYQTQTRMAENQQDPIEIVRARSLMNGYITDNQQRQENNDRIWETLRNANRGMVEHTMANPGELELAGWLALNAAYQQNLINPTQLSQAIDQWKLQYPGHSATQILPSELQRLAGFHQTELNGVALLLPLTGDQQILGETIKKGFDEARGKESAVAVDVYDTATTPIVDILAQARQKGTRTVVGPLLKNRVDELISIPNIGDLNILALNSTPNARAVEKVCYYGLSLEAEARSGADRLQRDKIENAIVIAPQNEFGQRSAEAFAQRWRQLTYRDSDVRYYHQPMEAVTTLQSLALPANSALYLLGTPQQLLELKQGLDNSNLANKLPLYTSSRSNSPNNGPDFRLAMEGVKFSETPLLADTNSDAYKAADTVAESDFSMMRLYAMGSDAWSIANKFNEFRQIPGYKVSGLTGVLSAGTNCNIEREMTWLQYQNGSVVPAN